MARNTILTTELVEEFAQLIRDGNYFKTVCAYVGVSEQDAYNWLSWGAEGNAAQGDWPEAYVTFFESVTRASAEAEVKAVALVRQAGEPQDFEVTEKGFAYPVVQTPDGVKLRGDLKANLEFLARRFRQHWSPSEKREISGPDGGPQKHAFAHLSAKEAIAIISNGGPYRHEEDEVDEADDDSDSGTDASN